MTTTDTIDLEREVATAAQHADVADPVDFYRYRDLLTSDERLRLADLRAYLEREVAPIADEYWERAESPRQVFRPLADLGLYGAGFPEVAQFDNSALFRGWVSYEMARVDSSVATMAGVHSGLAMNAVAIGGSDEQRADLLPKMARGEIVGAFGLTEPFSGSDTARGIRTTARRDGDEWVLDGAKRWIGNATFADIVVIWARDVADSKVKGFLVTRGTPGFTATKIERKQSLRAVENADITLVDVRLPDSARLARVHSFREVALILRQTRSDVAWQALGNGVGAYEAAVAYARSREQFGRVIGSYQLVQSKLVTCLTEITASIALCTRTAQLQDAGTLTDEQSAMAKATVSERMRRVVALCREILGGNGIQLDYGVARHFADAEAIYTYEGTHDMNTLIVGRDITGIPAFA
ncbi:acyl-CoA dehydrogenase family protein [Microbacterium hominis]|uniref:Acyl-CoA dehydrogenase family protein n=1 Tax=Microbacterium hominis TaxID=162426 RepID=A0A7D4Q063_9MICO|nr:acyl-CoA dehydrogenase family protein [Microbacterium hominis]QKJ18932.1 acyl-CoA dehydrogenase family protein [Microbacterium hominis]